MTYGIVHAHSEHSLNDGAMTVKEIVQTAKSMGVKAITLTDHGTCTGWIEFLKEAKKQGIKGIPGVEAYVKSNATDKRCHMLLLAKNKKGYQEISKAVSLSNQHIDRSVSGYAFPMMDKKLLAECFGNGNVIATSACVAGILSQVLLHNYYLDREVEKIERKQKKYPTLDQNQEYEAILAGKAEKTKEIAELRKKKKELAKIAGKDYTRRETMAMSMFDFLRDQILEEIEEEKKESQKAAKELIAVDAKILEETSYLNQYKKVLSKMEKNAVKYKEYQDKIDALLSQKYTKEDMIFKAEKEMEWFHQLFGKDFYIEMQYHGMPTEKEVFPILANLARKHQIPLIAANDAHIATKQDVSKREFLRSLRYNQWEEASKYDAELYLKNNEELSDALEKILPQDVVKEAINNIQILCDSCEEIDLMHETHYPKYRDEKNEIVKDSASLLKAYCQKGIQKYFPNNWNDVYQKRLEYELDVIIRMGFADYLLIVADYVNYGKHLAMINNEEHIGYGIGPGRGSGAGSLVNYLIGITSIDPIPYNLLFERFLNEERVTMPDIDVDFSKEVREECIAYVTEKYGKECVAAIRTKLTQAAKASVHNAARLLGDKESNDKSKYLSLGNRIAKEIPFAPNTTFETDMGEHLTVKKHLQATFSDNKPAQTIIQMATETEGAMTSLGVHAAGIVIADGNPLYDYIPIINMEKSGMAIQCDMVEIEEIGCLKMDFLGLKNLDILSHAQRLVKQRYGLALDLDHLPQEREVYQEIFSKGFTDSVFQYESDGMKKMLRAFKPDCFEDIILLVAAYRPGPMQYLQGIIDVKNGKKEPEYLCKELIPILSTTYGAIIYQEQVMSIFQKLAGYSLGGADIVRRYMSKKKADMLAKEKAVFVYGDAKRHIPGCVANGISETVALELFDQMTDFAKYAFNKSHAAAYAMISYQTAYVKYHYPKEYMSAVLTYSVFDKYFDLSRECKRMGIPFQVPDINHSAYAFSPDEKGILYGLCGIKGAGSVGKEIVENREKQGQFLSFKDFYARMKPAKDVAEALILAGCFDSLYPKQRGELLHTLPELAELYKKIERKKISIEKKEEKTASLEDKKEKTKADKALLVLKNDLRNLMKEWDALTILDALDEPDMLEKERTVLGAYVSGHILDYYRHIYTKDVMLFQNFKPGYATVAGVVRDVRHVKGYIFFLLDDPTGTYEMALFDAEKYGMYVEEGAVIRVHGKGKIDYYEDSERIKITCNKIVPCHKEGKSVVIDLEDPTQFCSKEFQNFFASYIDPDGLSVLVRFRSSEQFKKLKVRIHPNILNTNIPIDGVRVFAKA